MTEISTEGTQAEESIKQKNSGFGIASFIMSIVVGVLLFVLFAIAGFISASTPGGMDKESAQAVIIGLSMLALLFCVFISMVLGIIGLFQKERKKLFAILGTVFSSLILMVGFAVIVLGVIVSQKAM